MDEDTIVAFKIYCNHVNSWPSNGYELEDQLEFLTDSCRGYFGGAMKDAQFEYAYQYVEDMGMLSGVPAALEQYFDYEALARDIFLDGHSEYNGHIFIDC